MGRESEEPPQMEVVGKSMLGQIDKLNINKFSAPDGVYTGVLEKHTPQIRIFWIANYVWSGTTISSGFRGIQVGTWCQVLNSASGVVLKSNGQSKISFAVVRFG